MNTLLERSVKVGTVDSYQGKENAIIVLSLVRNNDTGSMEGGSRRIREGFLSEPNRVNVAASRAMDRLVVVGALQRWRRDGPLGRLAEGFAKAVEEGQGTILRAVDVVRDDAHEGVATTSGPISDPQLSSGAVP